MAILACPACRQTNPDHALFCLTCGTRLASACPQCGAHNATAVRFCSECGTYLVESSATAAASLPQVPAPKHLVDKVLDQRSAIEGERKLVTVLFADIRGSLELIVGRDPEVAWQILGDTIAAMTEAVHRFEGTVNRVLGDGIMALFGAPLAHEDHALRACMAALEMRERVIRQGSAIYDAHGVHVEIRIGLNSGEVLVRAIRNDLSMDYDAVGETVHMAARMEQTATPGSIRLTGSTFNLVEGLVEGVSRGPTAIKGFPAKVEVFELLRARLRRGWLRVGTKRGLTPFVDREAATQALARAATASTGGGQVVAIVGDAGCGKSRLLYEFATSAAVRGWQVLETHAASYATTITYYPILALLKSYLDVDEREDTKSLRAKIISRFERDEMPSLSIQACLALFELDPGSAEWRVLDPLARRRLIQEMITSLLVRLSTIRPLMLIVEDLQWMDAETTFVLDRLIDELPGSAVLLLTSYRPEYQDSWGDKAGYSKVHVDPLAPRHAADLLRSLIGNDPSMEPFEQSMIERTGGNPFFIEESINALLDDDALVRRGNNYRLAKTALLERVPATCRALIAARVDRLSFAEKRLLQSAAVIGRELPIGLLTAVVDVPSARIGPLLDRLRDAEFLYQTADYPEPEYSFRHALIHEVCYAGLLQNTRVELHSRIVEAIEQQHGDRVAEHFERLADHAVRGQGWRKAAHYARLAGAKAARRSANVEAVRYYDLALEALHRLPRDADRDRELIDTCLEVRFPLFRLPQMTRLIELLDQAETLAMALNDERRLCQILYFRCHALWLVAKPDSALVAGTRAHALAVANGDTMLQVRTRFQMGLCYYTLCDFQGACDAMRETLARLNDPEFKALHQFEISLAIMALSYLLRALAEIGEFAEALPLAEEAKRLTESFDEPFHRIFTSAAIGYLELQRGEIGKAIPQLEVGLELCHSTESHLMIPPISAFLAAAYTASGRALEAVPLLESAIERAAEVQTMIQQPQRLALLGRTYLALGRGADALNCVQSAIRLSEELKEPGGEAHARCLYGEILMAGQPLATERATEEFRQAITIAERLSMSPLAAHAHQCLNALYLRVGRTSEARLELAAATALNRAMMPTAVPVQPA
jgi:predicted ATPase/class 3 adenylate cyclase